MSYYLVLHFLKQEAKLAVLSEELQFVLRQVKEELVVWEQGLQSVVKRVKEELVVWEQGLQSVLQQAKQDQKETAEDQVVDQWEKEEVKVWGQV